MKSSRSVRARQLVQVACLLLFFALAIATCFHAGSAPGAWLKLFFLIDPLILLATWLTTHTLVATGLWALLTIAVTIVMGRVFCGWICPLGTLHSIAGWIFDRVWPDRKRRDHWSPWQRTKYYLLVGFLAMAVLGGHWVCVMDPIVLLYRSTAVALLPGTQWALEETSTAIYKSDPGVGSLRLAKLTEPAYQAIRTTAFNVEKQAFLGGGVMLAIFVLLLLLNKVRPRFWCRYVCPLGALLGVFGRWPILRRKVNSQMCNQCDLCAQSCHGAAGGAPGDQWTPSECLGCLNCTDSCRRDSLSFTFVAPWRKAPRREPIDLSRRATIAAAVGGLATLGFFRSSPQARGKIYNPALVRPPGARAERDFLKRCTACGVCMKVCPTGGLQPTWSEAGLEGLWTPRLVPRIGQCDYTCNLCGQVCPTEAIQPLTVEEKQKVRIGLASFDVTRCIPYAYARECTVCEEHCPIPDKAIYTIETEIVARNGEKKSVKQPHVDPEKCIGCGICENVCPFKDRPGVRVTSANETRHPDNQPILGGDAGGY
jgi:polyferredoxin/ferredoxin